jgi:hypothetical protein
MFDRLHPSVVTFKSSILLVGGLITFYAYRAYRRTNYPFLGVFTVGFGLVALAHYWIASSIEPCRSS